jgi:hypothetical protein
MNHLWIKKINDVNLKACELSLAFDKENVPFYSIAYANWSKYPYKPDVKFRVAHDGKNIFLNYQVDELNIKAVCDKDNGKVWEDSCVEFFISFGEDAFYYNIECNCIGKVLVATGINELNRMAVPAIYISRIDRWSSLGALPVDNRSGQWELSLIIPIEVFLLNKINRFDGIKAKGNFYKCGDNLKTPHFLSWNPIKSINPNFHLSGFFGEILFG